MRMRRGLGGLVLAGALLLSGCLGHSQAVAHDAPARKDTPGAREARETEARLADPTEEQPSPEEERKAREDFAQRAIAALRASGEQRPIHYDRENFLLQLGGKEEGHFVSLSNLYGEYLAAPPERREELFTRFTKVRQAPSLPDTFAQARRDLMPVVRGRVFFEQTATTVPIAWRLLGGFLGVGLAFDGPDTLRYLKPEELKHWGVSFEQAFDVAMENLRQRSTEPLAVLAPGTCQSAWNDTYGSSRLLLEEVVLHCPVLGLPVVLVPHRDLLLVTGSQDEEGQRMVAGRALDAMLAPRALDGRALLLTPEGWRTFRPERLSNAWTDFRKLELFTRARDYSEQTQQLEKLYAEKHEDVFVAAYTPYQDEHGRSLSYALWLKGVDTLLPRTEVIFFMNPELGDKAPPVGIARWEDVARVTGALRQPVEGLYPERYRVRTFPTPEQLSQWQSDPNELFDEPGH
jgi:uncharacterized protein YtpQ (UPF0354 family)